MRLSALAHQQGIDTYTAEDFKFVSTKVGLDPGRLILVGGQAIQVWAMLLDVPSPLGNHEPLTEDTDWLGGKRDAQWLCEQLGNKAEVELHLNDGFDSSVSTALAYLQRGQRILLLDFLRSIVGPEVDEIRKIAVTVPLAGNVSLCVMHPLQCLHSRFANLRVLSSKRRGNGPLQAAWAVSIAAAYLRQQVKLDRPKEQIAKACRMIADIAEYDDGKYCYPNFQLDALEAVPDDVVNHIGNGFAQKEWPVRVARIRRKQQTALALHNRRVAEAVKRSHLGAAAAVAKY